MKKYSKYIIAILVAVIFAVGFEFAIIKTTPTENIYSFQGAEDSLFPSSNVTVDGYDVSEDNSFTMKTCAPYIFFGEKVPAKNEIRSMKITLSSPAEANLDGQVFYSAENEEFSARKTRDFTIQKGEVEGVVNFNEPLDKLKIFIDGNFNLKSIETSSKPLEKTPVEATFNASQFMTLFVIFAAIFVAIAATNTHKKAIDFFVSIKLKNVIKYIVLLAISCGLFNFALFVATKFVKRDFTIYMAVFATAVGIIAASLIYYRKKIGEKPENAFLAISVSLTLILSICLSVSAGASWDIQIHYNNSLKQSFIGDTYITDADFEIINIKMPGVWSVDGAKENGETLNALYEEGTILKESVKELSNKQLGNFPNAVGMFLARIMGMSFCGIFIMGRIANGLFYSFIMYLAIKKLKYGKMILASIALIPTSIFTASTYSYDMWVVALSSLGLAYFLYELQTPKEKINWANIAIMISSLTLGYATKAIYFPIILLLLLIPKEKFKSRRGLRLFRIAIFGSIAVLMLSFVIPYFITSDGPVGDLRGGSDVNGMKQIEYILTNPVSYAKTLIKFLIGYLSLEGAQGYVGFYAYLGTASNVLVALMVIVVASFTDRRPEEGIRATVPKKLFVYLVSFGTIALCATALYIDFTSVGSSQLIGCQPRYIIPVLFPVLYFVGFESVKNSGNRNMYNTMILGAMSLLNLYAIWEVLIKLYR